MLRSPNTVSKCVLSLSSSFSYVLVLELRSTASGGCYLTTSIFTMSLFEDFVAVADDETDFEVGILATLTCEDSD
jgi:hypothetical protein